MEAKIFSHDSLGRNVFGVRFECQFLDQNSPIVYFGTVYEWSSKTKLIGSDNVWFATVSLFIESLDDGMAHLPLWSQIALTLWLFMFLFTANGTVLVLAKT